jgi:hypothetical protein
MKLYSFGQTLVSVIIILGLVRVYFVKTEKVFALWGVESNLLSQDVYPSVLWFQESKVNEGGKDSQGKSGKGKNGVREGQNGVN